MRQNAPTGVRPKGRTAKVWWVMETLPSEAGWKKPEVSIVQAIEC